MHVGYNTNGLPFHRLSDAVDLIAAAGFTGIALTPDHHHLDLLDHAGCPAVLADLQVRFERHKLRAVVETGARFVLNPGRKHWPTLLGAKEDDRLQRLDFLDRCVRLAGALGAETVSLGSGAPDEGDGTSGGELYERLARGLRPLLQVAATRSVRLALEPEPGMLIDRVEAAAPLFRRIDHPLLGLTLDVAHLYCQGEGGLRPHLTQWRSKVWNIHLADAPAGRHEHLMFGEGIVDFDEVFDAIVEADFRGMISVELSRHGHVAPTAVRQAAEFVRGHLKKRGMSVMCPSSRS